MGKNIAGDTRFVENGVDFGLRGDKKMCSGGWSDSVGCWCGNFPGVDLLPKIVANTTVAQSVVGVDGLRPGSELVAGQKKKTGQN